MGIHVINAGPRTTIQDKGRMGYQNSGFAPSGFMDRFACRRANVLVNNEDTEAVIEFCIQGPMLKFDEAANIAVSGGNFKISVDGAIHDADTAIHVKAGQTVMIITGTIGTFGSIAVGGGLAIPEIMGSRSTNIRCEIGGFNGRALKNGDVLEMRNPGYAAQNLSYRRLPARKLAAPGEVLEVRVIPGPQDDAFTEKGIETFYSSEYTVTTHSDRMGYRLSGGKVETKNGSDIISDGIVLGSIQISGSGDPIVMMADRQTTGGYVKIATVIHVDLPQFVQLRPGQKVRFVPVTVQEAQQLYFECYERWDSWKKSIIGPLFNPRNEI
ncbi:MAG: biotin-dependent carboxyltransferase family protein [Lachnospiraceae bacterium]|jgi:biotin-dependent carboxylase-like uncharacterized protein